MPGAQVLDHLIRLQHIGSDLIAPAGIPLAFMGVIDGGVAPVQLHLIKPRFQSFHGDVTVLVLGFFRTCHHDASGVVGDAHCRIRGVDVLSPSPGGTVGINPDIGGVNLDLDIIIDHWINPNRAKRSVALGGAVKR